MKKTLLIAIPVIAVVVALFLLMRGDNSPDMAGSPSPTPTPSAQVSPTISPAANNDSQVQTITYTDSGFSPATLNVDAGTTVKFVNNSTLSVWPASAMHPIHNLYPGSDIAKCGTGVSIFDACVGLAPGQSWSFTFDSKGEWKYHDHLRVKHFGTIIVK
ncbi:MAG: hypothetical protein A3J46_00780 [Candidatus Yanofskybacteria bacterium RIFCSPHIGHO2_02_FULL_41_11]|uniref:Blue (type 1) copper domain-containing protein n=1 Tax=Candidatus Yanofskybacteria bacterium RIFCSPHIGHO2_02_FULL_41_11 TaxID=1802675 RepID=A0A1F8F9G2_9BACT|nr:MAG: hypothetical protein A3J46_00780 [Candidatus Yanofskybacteria bacterium RIFCSPHIGHO2_02_FULL_41_11]